MENNRRDSILGALLGVGIIAATTAGMIALYKKLVAQQNAAIDDEELDEDGKIIWIKRPEEAEEIGERALAEDEEEAVVTNVLDLDGDGEMDAVLLDTDGDGEADTALVDTDGDGVADTALIDLDGDGTFDVAVEGE